MKKSVLLLAGVLLVSQTAFAGLGIAQMSDTVRLAPAPETMLQLAAEEHGCAQFGKANHCRARWNTKAKNCVCVG